MSRAVRALAAAVAAAAVVAASVAAAAPAAAQSRQSLNRLALASQTAWVGPGDELVLRLHVATDKPLDQVEVAVAVHRRVTGRIEFARTREGRPRGAPLGVTATALAHLAVDPGGAVVVRLPVNGPDQAADATRLRLRDEGVYPVRVELREVGGGEVLAELATHLLYASPPEAGGHRLGAALVLPVHAPPSIQPDGSRRLSQEEAAGLGVLARSLAAHPGTPVTLAPTPETLEALASSHRAADRETLATLARSLGGHQVTTGPFVPINYRAFRTAGLDGEAAAQLDRGSEAIESTLGLRADPRTSVIDEHLDDATVASLRQQRVDRMVVPESSLAPTDLPVTLAQPFELEARSVRRPLVLAADTGLAGYFGRRDDPVLAAHQLLAEMAVVYFDRPGHVRAVVARAPRSWRPTTPFLDTLLEGLASSPVLSPRTVDQVFAEVPLATAGSTRSSLVRRLAPPPAPAPSLPASAFADARRKLESFGSMLDPDNALDDTMESLLLTAGSSELRPRQRSSYLEGLGRRITSETGLIRLPENRAVTLTARTGVIPVTIGSEADYRVRMQVEVNSVKLNFPQGSARPVELTRRNTTERFAVETRTAGAFPLRVRVLSPDGGLVVASSQFTVRSRPSGVGVVLSAGAGGFLVLWWARHRAQARRNRRLVPT